MKYEWTGTRWGQPATFALENEPGAPLTPYLNGEECDLSHIAVSTYGFEILRLAEENRALKAERDALAVANRDLGLATFDKVAADRLADEVAALVVNRHLDSRSAAADALLDYREPPRTERSDRIADLLRLREQDAETLRDQALEIGEKHDRIVALEEENRRLKEWLPRFVAKRAEDVPRADLVTRLFRDEIASGGLEGLDWKAAEDLRGYVVWHRHDGDLVKLVRVSEQEELVPGATISVSYDPHPEEVS